MSRLEAMNLFRNPSWCRKTHSQKRKEGRTRKEFSTRPNQQLLYFVSSSLFISARRRRRAGGRGRALSVSLPGWYDAESASQTEDAIPPSIASGNEMYCLFGHERERKCHPPPPHPGSKQRAWEERRNCSDPLYSRRIYAWISNSLSSRNILPRYSFYRLETSVNCNRKVRITVTYGDYPETVPGGTG